MKQRFFIFSVCIFLFSVFQSCGEKKDWLKNGQSTAAYQLKLQAEEIADSAKLPRSIRDNKIRLVDAYDWTSGFFPGSLWYMYELTNNDYYKKQAVKYTNLLYAVKDYRDTHDLGFMIYCSYGNAFRITGDTAMLKLLIQTADNLASRFSPKTQTIRSWDFGKWQYPVIIDNMMNLELLFWASEYTKNPKYKEIAIRHANTTMKNHYRSDMSCYHVVNYDSITGRVISKGTHQGYSDSSSWARGQAWGLYGYTLCYRFTRDKKYLDFAQKIASYIMKNVKTSDLIPYWDYNASNIPNAPRDASAAAVTASALLELCQKSSEGKSYFTYAETILKNLSNDKYLAKEGTNKGFILMHSVGSLPHNSEIDTPLNYADYYYLEALKRYIALKK